MMIPTLFTYILYTILEIPEDSEISLNVFTRPFFQI